MRIVVDVAEWLALKAPSPRGPEQGDPGASRRADFHVLLITRPIQVITY
jgi:hypothetical protein